MGPQSKFHGYSNKELEGFLERYEKELSHIDEVLNREISESLKAIFRESRITVTKNIIELRTLLRPQVDYEDGTWV